MDWTTLGLQALAAIAPFVVAVIGYAAHRGARFLAERTKSEYLRAVSHRLDEAAYDIVAQLEQTLVSGIRRASEDGRITPSEAREIREQALAEVLEYLGPKGVEELERLFDRPTLERIIRAKIESSLLRMKAWAPKSAGAS